MTKLSTVVDFFFVHDTATTELYTLSLHDALPISDPGAGGHPGDRSVPLRCGDRLRGGRPAPDRRSEEHTSELQSLTNLVCRLLLEKKKKNKTTKSMTQNESQQEMNHNQ